VDDDETVQRVLRLFRELEEDDVVQMEKTIRQRKRKQNVKRSPRFARRNCMREVDLSVENASLDQMRPRTRNRFASSKNVRIKKVSTEGVGRVIEEMELGE
jgi:hypothetical protein